MANLYPPMDGIQGSSPKQTSQHIYSGFGTLLIGVERPTVHIAPAGLLSYRERREEAEHCHPFLSAS